MEKRNWPWRKKAGVDRSGSPNESLDSASIQSSSRHLDYQDGSSAVSDHPRETDDGSTHWQDYEERMKVLNDKLSAALMDAASRELLAKQHAKLAEEAVSGWETVEAEAAIMKQQLEEAIQQKLATEDRVSHLDGALKECMRQLRNMREEQEENIHTAVVKKTREWDRLQCDLEEKIVDLEHTFLEKVAENKVMSRSLSERARTIAQINDACANAQAEVSRLRVRLESTEKEKVALKYELSVAHKEIEIRNEEKGLSKRAADAASRQHLEDVKKVARLESECQRLRSLIRKKLPGPAAVAQMRLEVESLGVEKTDSRKKSGKGNFSPGDSMQELSTEDNHQAKEAGVLSDRFYLLEEETKSLRQTLAKRDNELHSARLICARTANKLSAVEQQLETLNIIQDKQRTSVVLDTRIEKIEQGFSSIFVNCNDGEVNCAESWATALIAELDQFKKEKLTPGLHTAGIASELDINHYSEAEEQSGFNKCEDAIPKRDNFSYAEKRGVEEDASLSFWKSADSLAKEGSIHASGIPSKPEIDHCSEIEEQSGSVKCDDRFPKQDNSLDTQTGAAEKDVGLSFKKSANRPATEDGNQAACKLCEEFRLKLAAAEEDLARKESDLTKFAELKSKIVCLFEEGIGVNESWEKLIADMDVPECQRKLCPAFPSNANQEGSHGSKDPNSSLHGVVLELTTAACEIISLLKSLATVSNNEDQLIISTALLSSADAKDTPYGSFSRKLDLDDIRFQINDLDAKCDRLKVMSDRFIAADVDLSQVLMEVSSVVSLVSRANFVQTNTTSSSSKNLSFKSSNSGAETDFGLGSPLSDTSKSECSEAAARIVPADESLHTFRKDCFSSEVARLEEELRKAQAERVALETHMKADYERFNDLEEELFQLKLTKGELEACLVKDKEEILQLKADKYELEQRLCTVHAELSTAESSKQLLDQQACDMTAAKEEMKSQLLACKDKLEELHTEMNSITKELLYKEQKNSELDARCKELQEQLEMKLSWSCSKCAKDAAAREDQLCRELEIAAASEKLAECERTIMLLGQQLKALSSPKGFSYQGVQNSPSLITGTSFDLPPSLSSNHSPSPHDSASELSNSIGRSQLRELISNDELPVRKSDPVWDPRASIASDILDSELISLSMPNQSGRLCDLFGDRVPVHEDYIKAVAQMPSSPEAEQTLPKRVPSKPPRRKKRSPRSFVGIDMTKSMNDAFFLSSEKNGSSFSRFFSRTKSSS